MEVVDIVILIINVGFLVILCFILVCYVLDIIGEWLVWFDDFLKELFEVI